ncbi:MAG: UDP-glucose/GDP-mannose dehydrogenase family protein, partial [Bacteroidales bacterium]|nr:UDP-glucose/GDP-mannose dehydrogenase family protein [Bacteroidales bacterium]
GIEVCCVDVDQRKIDMLKRKRAPIFEQGLEELLVRNVDKGRLTFSTSLKDAMQGAEVIFCAVGTPPDEDGSADLRYVLDVAREVGRNMNDYVLLVTKSTVPVGTARKVKQAVAQELAARGVTIDFDVASNPEFLKEGAAVKDFMYPERVVVGVESERARDVMSRLYKPFTLNGNPVLFMDVPSAEMTKYAANAMLATRISFMNDIANLCEKVGANVKHVRKGMGSDSRIGSKFLYPGIGYGGSCFPKDVKALIKTADGEGYDMQVLKAVEAVNGRQKSLMFRKYQDFVNGSLNGKTVGMWGLSFKPGTDDMREASSLVMIEAFLKAGCTVKVYDPVAMDECRRRIGDRVVYCDDMYRAAVDTDALFLVTEWTEFRSPDWHRIGNAMRARVLLLCVIHISAPTSPRGGSYAGVGVKK